MSISMGPSTTSVSRPPSCWDCRHLAVIDTAAHCSLFSEQLLWDAAPECDQHEPR